MLAPITGKERHLTLGTGHCIAICKAANAGGRTPISYIQDSVGNINLHFLKSRRQYKTMLEKGWEFTQLSWRIEAAGPTSPDLLQRALNTQKLRAGSEAGLDAATLIQEVVREYAYSMNGLVRAAPSRAPRRPAERRGLSAARALGLARTRPCIATRGLHARPPSPPRSCWL